MKLLPFYSAAAIWALLGCLIAWFFRSPETETPRIVLSFLGLWALSVFDLFALAMVVRGLLTSRVVSLLIWGPIKFSCLGLFGIVLLRGRSIPTSALLAGMATLMIVPLVGGIIAHHRSGREGKD